MFEKSQGTLIDVDLFFLNDFFFFFFFVIYRNWLNYVILQNDQNLFKNGQSHDAKKQPIRICFLNERIRFNSQQTFNGGGIKIQSLINNHIRINSSEYTQLGCPLMEPL